MPLPRDCVSSGDLHQDLVEASNFDLNFLVLVVASCVIATLGLLINSAGVIIGAMIIAPLMNPLRSLALGALIADKVLLRRSLLTLGSGTGLAIVTSAVLGGLFQIPALSFGPEILARTQPTLADLGVALAAGGVSGFAKIRPKVSDVLAGTAIAVALMPPLCVVGISLSQGAWAYSWGSFLLFLTNLLGITLACILTFIWGGYALGRRNMRRAVLWFACLTGLVLVPLSVSLLALVQQGQLKATIKDLLQRETITLGQQVQLVDIQLFRPALFSGNAPDRVTLTVMQRTGKEVTPRQVKELERFLQKRLNRPIELVVRAFEYQEVRSEPVPPGI